MTCLLGLVCVLALPVAAGFALLSFGLQVRLSRVLASRHPDLWHRLPEESGWGSLELRFGGRGPGLPVRRFLRSLHGKPFGDDQVDALVEQIRSRDRASLAFGAIGLLALAAALALESLVSS